MAFSSGVSKSIRYLDTGNDVEIDLFRKRRGSVETDPRRYGQPVLNHNGWKGEKELEEVEACISGFTVTN
jgi:hypothetical protein